MKSLVEKRPVVDAAARIVTIVLAILLMGVPVVLMLMLYGVLSPAGVQDATGYQSALNELGRLSDQHGELTSGFYWFGGASAGIAVISLVLLGLMAFVRARARDAIVQDEPGRETRVRARAIRHLAEYGARDAGAADPDVRVRTRLGRQNIACSFHARDLADLPALAENVQKQLSTVLAEQGIKVGKVEAMVEEPAPSEAERVRVS